MSVSALAFIKGYLQYKEDSRIAGGQSSDSATHVGHQRGNR
jgi:hypothetical protein